jgi:hypothetical protein
MSRSILLITYLVRDNRYATGYIQSSIRVWNLCLMQVMFHDPEDYPDSGIHTALVEPRQLVSVMLEAEVIESVNSVRWIDVGSRRCWFSDEVAVVQSSPSYSFQTCITECRMKVFQEKCGCIPFFYPLFGQYLSLNCHMISLPKHMNSYIYAQKCHLLVMLQKRAVACVHY